MIAFTLWAVGFITRFIVNDHAFEVSKYEKEAHFLNISLYFNRICMSVDLCLWYMRCLHIFLVSERLGPKLLKIFYTVKKRVLVLSF